MLVTWLRSLRSTAVKPGFRSMQRIAALTQRSGAPKRVLRRRKLSASRQEEGGLALLRSRTATRRSAPASPTRRTASPSTVERSGAVRPHERGGTEERMSASALTLFDECQLRLFEKTRYFAKMSNDMDVMVRMDVDTRTVLRGSDHALPRLCPARGRCPSWHSIERVSPRRARCRESVTAPPAKAWPRIPDGRSSARPAGGTVIKDLSCDVPAPPVDCAVGPSGDCARRYPDERVRATRVPGDEVAPLHGDRRRASGRNSTSPSLKRGVTEWHRPWQMTAHENRSRNPKNIGN